MLRLETPSFEMCCSGNSESSSPEISINDRSSGSISLVFLFHQFVFCYERCQLTQFQIIGKREVLESARVEWSKDKDHVIEVVEFTYFTL